MPKLAATLAIILALAASPLSALGEGDDGEPLVKQATTLLWSGSKYVLTSRDMHIHWAATLLGALAVSPLDGWATSTDIRAAIMPDNIARVGDLWGDPIAAVIILPSVFIADRLLGYRSSETGDRLLFTVTSLAMVGVTTVSLKYGFGRERPNGHGTQSLPSGHTSVSFGVAEVVRQLYGNRASAIFYLLAVNTALSRIHDNKHYPSDVVGGAGLGMGIVRGFALAGKSSSTNLSTSLRPSREGFMVSLQIALD